MSCVILLTKGLEAIVDDCDYQRVDMHSWFTYTNSSGSIYAVSRLDKKSRKVTPMHTFISGAEKPFVTDHINHNTLDNRRCNLRICTVAQNNSNRSSRKNSSSKYLGVSKKGNKFYSNIAKNGEKIFIGSFDTEILAALAYDNIARKLHGEFANLNFK